MKISAGTEVFRIGSLPVVARGLVISREDFEVALTKRLVPILWDDSGREMLGDFLSRLGSTSFETGAIKSALSMAPPLKDWQVGEAVAQAHLIDHEECEFPWPIGRDLRNPNASASGADLVGFQNHDKSVRFAFGEVKTSAEGKYPPNVVFGRSGLTAQVETLRDNVEVKNQLALIYLGFRAIGSAWKRKYEEATKRFLKDATDVSLFGFLIRDVEPNEKDWKTRWEALAKSCPTSTSILLCAIYLPPGAIATLAIDALSAKGTVK